jgi:aspartyl-tRNA(Asn)/glutamyl-tRNA(Gln) amidotransferase subunit A
MSDELWKKDAFALSELLSVGQITPIGILQIYLDRIAGLNKKFNAVVCLNDDAMDDAQQSAKRHRMGEARSPIDGIPMLIKDNLIVGGMPATWGSRLYEDRECIVDEIPVEKLRQAGAIIVGKTNVPEFTVEGYTDNNLFGVTPNPWNLSVTPGGSSGGSVAAVSAGLIPMSIGTDGGGSIRRPAAYTNLVGLKPSIGRIPRGGGLPQLLLDMEVVGPITRSVRDCAMLFDILAQPDLRDHRSLRFSGANSMDVLSSAPQQLNILAVERFGDAPIDPHISVSFQKMVTLMSDLGHRVETGQLPFDIQPVNEIWASIANISLGLLLKREPNMRELASKKYVEWGEVSYDATHLLKITEIISELRNQAARSFDKIDIIMTPSCAAMPWSTKIPFPSEIDNQSVGPRGSAIYTGWVNACGHPAINLPGELSPRSMPIGIQFVGNYGQDELLLRLAQQIELQHSNLDQWPTIAYEGEQI